MQTHKSLQLIIDSLPLLFQGACMTIQVALGGIAIGLVFGILVGIIQSKKLKIFGLSQVLDFYILVMRGTPIYVQLLLVYYALPDILGINLSPFAAGVITIGFNSVAYIAETVRGGMNAIFDGQWDACYVLGYSLPATLYHIIVPQVIRAILPGLMNELIVLVKETSIISTIGLLELTKIGTNINARALDPITIYLAIALFYLFMTSILALGARFLETRFLEKGYAHDTQ